MLEKIVLASMIGIWLARKVHHYYGDSCYHGSSKNIDVTVLGKSCHLSYSPFCKTCTELYLNKNAAICDSCKQPILPGSRVGMSGSAINPYVHLTFKCAGNHCRYIGTWGEGKLIKFRPAEWALEEDTSFQGGEQWTLPHQSEKLIQ